MNYVGPLVLSIFIHLGIGFSFSNIFNIDFDAFNIDSSKPITAYVLYEERKEIPKPKIRITDDGKKTNLKTPIIEKITLQSSQDLLKEIQQVENLKINEVGSNNDLSLSDVQKYSSVIKRQVISNWKKPKGYNENLRTEIQIDLVPTGEIISSKVIKGSGNEAFDESAMMAVSRVEYFDGLNMQSQLFENHFRKFILIFTPD